MRGSAALFQIAVEFGSKRLLCPRYWRRKPLISCRSIMRPAGLPLPITGILSRHFGYQQILAVFNSLRTSVCAIWVGNFHR